MGAEARGRIVLYIDGKEIPNQVKSIKAELKKLQYEQDKMIIGSKDYVEKTKQISSLKGVLAEHNAGLKATTSGWMKLGKVADGFNRYFAMFTAGIAAVAGFAVGIGSLIKKNEELDEVMANVRKTTGLTMVQIIALSGQFQMMNTGTSRKELLDLAVVAGKLGIEGYQNILGFVKGANKIKVALAEDLGGNVEEAINTVGKLVDIFKLKEQFGIETAMTKVGSVINALGASSAASEQNIVDFLKRLGGVGPNAKMSVSEIAGIGSTLDALGQQAETSGTAMSQFILGMFKKTPEYAKLAKMSIQEFSNLLATDANEALIAVLKGLKGNNAGMQELAANMDGLGLDGARAVSVIGVLANNISMLESQQAIANKEFDKGTSIINEYNIKNETLGANISKIGKALMGAFVNSALVNGMKQLVGWMADMVAIPVSETIRREKIELNDLVSAITDYNTNAQTRKDLITELQGKYPDFLKNLNAEKVTNSELRDRLKEVNQEYDKKIEMQVKQEMVDKISKEIVKLRQKEVDVSKELAKARRELTDAQNKDYTGEQKGLTRYVNNVNAYEAKIQKVQTDLQFAYLQLRQVDKEYEESKKRLGIKDPLITPDGVTIAPPSGGYVSPDDSKGTKSLKLSKDMEMHPNRADYEDMLKGLKQLNEEIDRINKENETKYLNKNDKEMAAIDEKYNLLLEAAKGNAEAEEEIKRLHLIAIVDLYKKQSDELKIIQAKELEQIKSDAQLAYEIRKNELEQKQILQNKEAATTIGMSADVNAALISGAEQMTKIYGNFENAFNRIARTTNSIIRLLQDAGVSMDQNTIDDIVSTTSTIESIVNIIKDAIGIASMFGSGGYTGDGSTTQPAGIVHKKEYVNSAPVVESLGVGFFDILNSNPRNPDVEGAIASLGKRNNYKQTGGRSTNKRAGADVGIVNVDLAEINERLYAVIEKLYEKLDDGFTGIAVYDQEEAYQLRKRFKKMDEVDVAAKK
jgi:TP901 family phage tail tape measure protein